MRPRPPHPHLPLSKAHRHYAWPLPILAALRFHCLTPIPMRPQKVIALLFRPVFLASRCSCRRIQPNPPTHPAARLFVHARPCSRARRALIRRILPNASACILPNAAARSSSLQSRCRCTNRRFCRLSPPHRAPAPTACWHIPLSRQHPRSSQCRRTETAHGRSPWLLGTHTQVKAVQTASQHAGVSGGVYRQCVCRTMPALAGWPALPGQPS